MQKKTLMQAFPIVELDKVKNAHLYTKQTTASKLHIIAFYSACKIKELECSIMINTFASCK